ncbi:MAG: cytochrome c oxidase subunit II [Solirubrobacterales bacterium]|nr:cytochrome c oxidase subunit II [Solirubrobacterales bacterium]
MTRGTYLKLGGLSLLVGTVSSVIMLIPDWNGQAASVEAGPIDRLLDVMIVISSYVFAVVMVALFYALWRFRAKPGDESDGEPIHGNTKLEIAWTAIPTIIVLAAAIYSWVILEDIEAKGEDAMPIDVTAQQFAWTFDYPEEGISSDELHVPVDQQLELKLQTLDVIHSFWVPEWRIKRDIVRQPGTPSSEVDDDVVVTPNEEDEFTLTCTELCGLGHTTMRAIVVVESQEEFDQWVAEQKQSGETQGSEGSSQNDDTSSEPPTPTEEGSASE